MTILTRSSPDVIATAAMSEAAASRILEAEPSGTLEFGGGRVAATAAAPIPVYTIPLTALAEQRPSSLDDAVQHGWQVLTQDSSGSSLVDVSAATGRAQVVRTGAPVDVLRTAAARAEAQSGDRAYEPRLIDFGRVAMTALWLHSESDPDLIYRLDREPEQVTAEELLAEATRRARLCLARPPEGSNDSPDLSELGG